MKYVILGGGIAGTSVVEYLPLFCDSSPDITLISNLDVVKRAVGLKQKGETLASFEVHESRPEQNDNYRFIQGTVSSVDFSKKLVHLKSRDSAVPFDKLCIALGCKPKVIAPGNPYVLGIRDTDSVVKLQTRLSDSCYHVTVVGNGGIATEFIHSVRNCHITWVIRDKSISSVFIDPVAAKFFLDHLSSKLTDNNQNNSKLTDNNQNNCEPKRTALDSQANNSSKITKRHIFTRAVEGGTSTKSDIPGSALGPDWYCGYNLFGSQAGKKLDIEYECEVSDVKVVEKCFKKGTEVDSTGGDSGGINNNNTSPNHGCRLKVTLSNDKVILTDLVLSATGVQPNTELFQGTLDKAPDGGILVDKRMRTLRHPHVYAVGDVCSIPWTESDNWRQMRLWTQARSQALYTARSMAAADDEEMTPDISFEIFTHTTSFFGFKVIMLGRHKEWPGCQCYFRVTENVEFIKLVVFNNRLQGALLVGETDLEETFENLILNQLDISNLGEDILDPNIDIEDYFD